MTTNKYPGNCTVCGKQVEAEQGTYSRDNGLRHAWCAIPTRNTRSDRIEQKIAQDRRAAEKLQQLNQQQERT